MSSKPLWYHLFYSSNEELKTILENRTFSNPIKRSIKDFSYHEDMCFAANEYLINNFKPLPLVTSLGYIEPDFPDTSYLEDENWDEEEYLNELNKNYENYDDENEINEELEYCDSSSSAEEYDDDDEWTTA